MSNFLEKMLGGVSSYYEMLMKSRKDITSYTDNDVLFIADQLKDISQKAIFTNHISDERSAPTSLSSDKLPLNPKLEPLSFLIEFKINSSAYALFCDIDKAVKNQEFHKLIKVDLQESTADHSKLNESESLPIWEELVHRKKSINDEVKKRAPENPWSLYKTAKGKIIKNSDYQIQIGGYPQWLINDIDFRKIKKLEFLCELKLNLNCSVFYFNDSELDEIVSFKQKL
ncbi:MAG: hypothetical protein WBG46_05525 [Nonlabens sp.]